jgi:N utilization substance protein B
MPRWSIRQRRTAARLAAVQALYALEVAGGGGTERLIADLAGKRWRAGNEAAPDENWLRLLVDGVEAHRPRLDLEIDAALTQGWSLARLELLLRAILRAGAFELAEMSEVPTKVVINEYLDIAHAFYAGKEPGLINAVLDRLASRLRPIGAVDAANVAENGHGNGNGGSDDDSGQEDKRWTSSS